MGLSTLGNFESRHIGENELQIQEILDFLGFSTIEEFIKKVVPEKVFIKTKIDLPDSTSEMEILRQIQEIAETNKTFKSYIGQGFYSSFLPTVILRNIFENPSWYTSYTPYQAEIAQGRLEALLNFQTMISELTKMDISNASLLDEASSAGEAMFMSKNINKNPDRNLYFVSDLCHPQNIDVLKTKAKPLGIEIEVGDINKINFEKRYFGLLLQFTNTDGTVNDYENIIQNAKKNEIITTAIVDLLSLTLLKPPGEMGADIVVGSSQRFGLPYNYGGPHAAFIATKDEFKRSLPGRIVGVSKDTKGKKAYRLSLQTREQHIRRDKATSNICTAQALLAIIASMYAVYHGPKGLIQISENIHKLTATLYENLKNLGFNIETESFFDTIKIQLDIKKQIELKEVFLKNKINLRYFKNGAIGISIDETTRLEDIFEIFTIFGGKIEQFIKKNKSTYIPAKLKRSSEFLTQKVFNEHHTETKMLRYIKSLELKDISLANSMIPLGSCTMKLNATTEMIPLSWNNFTNIHPFSPVNQAEGYLKIFKELELWLGEITGLKYVSLQPNAGSQGEYAGLLCIRNYHENKKDSKRNVCLIPMSAHGTNPASAVMAGFKVIPVNCDSSGNVEVKDMKEKAEMYKNNLAALMITYPSTHGVFEESILEISKIIHENGGVVYMDGANMNAQVGLCRPSELGVDVCHLNLHKTFSIPHGGGGPGVGPICVNELLKDFLPGHSELGLNNKTGAITSTPWGSSIANLISWSYIKMMGSSGLKKATEIAILNANYIAKKLEDKYKILFKGSFGFVAHECIVDVREFKKKANIEVEDIAKRLIDYGFHAPTISWPVPGTMMIEPTESESKEELDRFCDALLNIYQEIENIEKKIWDVQDNPLKNAPHTSEVLITENWKHNYSRAEAVFPLEWVKERKYWPPVSRIDNVYGDRNLICTCSDITEFQ